MLNITFLCAIYYDTLEALSSHQTFVNPSFVFQLLINSFLSLLDWGVAFMDEKRTEDF